MPTSAFVTFVPGQTTALATVPVLGDTLIEPDEIFGVGVAPGSGYLVGRPSPMAVFPHRKVDVGHLGARAERAGPAWASERP